VDVAIASPGLAAVILIHPNAEIIGALTAWSTRTSTIVRKDRRYESLDVYTPGTHGL
jgi:hypothetical protein